jgi:hypothetical protein
MKKFVAGELIMVAMTCNQNNPASIADLDGLAIRDVPFTGASSMPWTPDDAERHTHKATTSALKELWAKIANEALQRTGDEGRAIREANAVVARQAGSS